MLVVGANSDRRRKEHIHVALLLINHAFGYREPAYCLTARRRGKQYEVIRHTLSSFDLTPPYICWHRHFTQLPQLQR
jgi:hypothetical protein